MTSRPRNSPSGRPREGFSLVLSLTVMAMLLLLCISAAALLAVELRVSRATISYAKARLNAIAAARVALGTLQAYAGPDRRITAPASLFDTNPATPTKSDGVESPHYVGVWKGKTVASDYAKGHDDAFVGWLASGDPANGATRPVDYPKGTRLNDANAVALFRPAALKPDNASGLNDLDPGAVYAAPDQIGENSGSIAWWIADENQKANLTLRLPKKTPSPAESLAMAQNSIRLGLKMTGDGVFEQFPETQPFSVPTVSRESLAFDRDSSAGSDDFWLKDPRNHYHDITPYSESLLTDVVNGGLKYDLSLMLALDKLPDGYRDGGQIYPFYYDMETAPAAANTQLNSRLAPSPVGLESTVPGAGPHAKSKGGWLKGLPAGTTLATSSLPPFNKLDWTGWPDVWSFARIYRLAESSYKDPNSANVMVFDSKTGIYTPHGAEPMCGTLYNGKTNTPTQNLLDRNAVNAVDMGNMLPWRMPVITAIQVSLSVRAQPSATPGKNDLYLVVRPYLQLWNPYNVPLRFLNKGVENGLYNSPQFCLRCLPGKLKVVTKDAAGATQQDLSWNQWQFNGGSDMPVAHLFLDARTEGPLAPGEVRIYSPTASGIFNRYTRDYGPTQVTPGFRPAGGYQFKIPVNPFDGDVQVALIPNDGPGYDLGVDKPAGPPMHIAFEWMMGGNDGANLRQCNGSGVRVEWNGNPEVALKIDPSTTDVSKGQLTQPQGQAFARLTMRLRSETTSTQKFPILAYGDPLRQVCHPSAVGSFRTNPEMRLSPFEFCHSKIRDDSDFTPDNPSLEWNSGNNRGYAFTGYTAGDGIDAMVLSHLPLAPVASLGDLRDARLGGGVTYHHLPQSIWDMHTDPITGKTKNPNISSLLTGGRSVVQDPLGNSFGHPMIPADKITVPSAHTSENYYDFSWIMNSSLWDAYCATGFSPENSSIPAFAGRTFGDLADDFLLKGKSLTNRRILFRDYGVGGEAIKPLLIDGDKPTDEAFAKAPAVMRVNGGFNINSTSVRAWRALLAGLNQSSLPQVDAKTPMPDPKATKVDAAGVALRSPIQNGPLAKESDPATFNKARALAGRELTEDQLTQLAQKIVEQVKLRGPFLSLGEFMNRRLEKGTLGERGAIQAAIDATKINAFAKGGSVQQVTAGDAAGFANPAAVVGSQARGMPGVVCQADIVSPLATALTARSDTFVIRAAGTSDDGAVAVVEIVVRRDAGYLDNHNEPFAIPNDPAKPLKVANMAFGRRFTPVAIRWLNRESI